VTVEVDRILNDNISIIYSLDPDAEVGYRGSLVTGINHLMLMILMWHLGQHG